MEERKKRSWCQRYQQDVSLCEQDTAELLSSPARSPLQGQLAFPPLPPPSSQEAATESSTEIHERHDITFKWKSSLAVPFEACRKTHQGFAKCFLPGGVTRAEKDRASSCSAGCAELGLSQSPGVTLCVPEEALGSAHSHIYCDGGACTHKFKL